MVANEQLGSKEGIACACANLAVIAHQRPDMTAACGHLRRARDVWREMGLAAKVAAAETWLNRWGCPDDGAA